MGKTRDLFKKVGDTKGTFHVRMGMIKDKKICIWYVYDMTLVAENEEELKSLLMREKEESGIPGLKLSIQKTKIMASSPIT